MFLVCLEGLFRYWFVVLVLVRVLFFLILRVLVRGIVFGR